VDAAFIRCQCWGTTGHCNWLPTHRISFRNYTRESENCC